MVIIDSIRAGLKKVNNNLHFIGLLWALNIAFAAILSMTVFRLLSADVSRSLTGDALLQGFDLRWYQEFFFRKSTALELFPATLVIVGSIYVLIQTFLLGGLLTVLNSDERKTLFIDFFYGGVQYFSRFFRILMLSLVLYAGLFLLNRWGTAATENLLGSSESEALRISVIVVRYIFLALLFFFLNIIFDYAKIGIVAGQENAVLKGWWRAVKFTVGHSGTTVGLFVLLFLMGAGIFGIYYMLDSAVEPALSYGMIFLVFVLHQIYISARIWLRMLFYASQLALWKEVHAEVISLSVEENAVHVPEG